MKEIIGLLLIIVGGMVIGFGAANMWPRIELPIPVIVMVGGIIILITGELIFLKSRKKDETPN